MHRCLLVSEILCGIFEAVSESPAEALSAGCEHSAQASGTLSAASQVCKAFYGPASDILWSALPSFSCLIRCLPRDTWNVDEAGAISVSSHPHVQRILILKQVQLIRVPLEDELARFDLHRKRVKSLTWTTFANAHSILQVILPVASVPFLPHLRTLYVESVDTDQLLHLPALFGPRLRNSVVRLQTRLQSYKCNFVTSYV